jgi:hypothetical protein
MNILTKRQAESAILNSLFQAGGTLACLPKERLDRGKYKDTIVGKDVPAHLKDRYSLVWAERGKDEDGPYFALFGIIRR